jgi:hypothetical protein
MNRPRKKNAVTATMTDELTSVFREVAPADALPNCVSWTVIYPGRLTTEWRGGGLAFLSHTLRKV